MAKATKTTGRLGLVISRRVGESFTLGDDITYPKLRVTVVRVKGQQVRLAVLGPRAVKVLRDELLPEDESPGGPA
jgi:carbon storage regulator CsrA